MVKRLFSASFFALLARAFSTLANLFMFFFVARFLGSATLGDYGVTFAFIQMFSISVSMGLPLFLSKELARFRDDLATSAIFFRETVAVTCNGFALAIVFLMLALLFYHPISVTLLLLSFISGVLLGLECNLSGLLLGFEKMPQEAAIQGGVLVFLCTLSWLALGQFGLLMLLTLRIALSALAIGSRLYVMRAHRPAQPWQLKLTFWREEKFYFISVLIDMLERNADIFILPFFLGKESLGDYFLVMRLYFSCVLFAEVLSNVLTPFISRVFHGHEQKSISRFAREVAAAGAVGGLVMAAILYMGAALLLHIFVPACSAEPVRMLHVLAFAIPFRFCYFLLGAFLTSTRFQSWRTSVSLIIVLGFTMLIPFALHQFGLVGVIGMRLIMDVAFFVTFFQLLFCKLLGPRGVLARSETV